MSFSENNFIGGGFKIEYIQYLVKNDKDFTDEEMNAYEEFYDGDVPQVTYMPYVFMMQDAYAKRQEEEIKKAEAFSKVFIPIDNFIMGQLGLKPESKQYIENDAERQKIASLPRFRTLDNDFKKYSDGISFFNYVNRGTSSEKTNVSVSAPFKGIPIRTGNTDGPFMANQINSNEEMAMVMGGGHRRSHKPSQKKTGKGKSRSRSRSRSKTRSKSKSKSKTRAKSKSKRR